MARMQESDKKESSQNTIWTDKTPEVNKKDILINLTTAINLMAISYKYNWYSNLEKNIRYIGFQIPTVVFYNSQNIYELLNNLYCIQEAKRVDRDSIRAFVIEEFTDEAMLQIILKSHPTQLRFKNWTYIQKIRLVKICDRYVREHSRQGKRTDLEDSSTCDQNKNGLLAVEETCVQNKGTTLQKNLTCGQSEPTPKPTGKSDRLYIRNIIAGQLGISPSAFKRYRQISKLDDVAINILSRGVDDGRVDSTAVHRVTQLKQGERAEIIELIKSDVEIEIKDRNLKQIYAKSKASKNDLTADTIKEILSPKETEA